MKALSLLLPLFLSLSAFGAEDLMSLITASEKENEACRKWERNWVDVSNPMTAGSDAEKKAVAERLIQQFKAYPGPNQAGRRAWGLILKQAQTKPERVQGELSAGIQSCSEVTFAGRMREVVESSRQWAFTPKQKLVLAKMARDFVVRSSAGKGDNFKLSRPIALFRVLADRKVVLLNEKQESELAAIETAFREADRLSEEAAKKANLPAGQSRGLSSLEYQKANALFVSNVKRLEAIRKRFSTLVASVPVAQ